MTTRLTIGAALVLLLAACDGGGTGTTPASETTTATTAVSEATTTAPEATTTAAGATTSAPGDEHEEGPVRTLEAPAATITIDGDPADWDGIAGLDLTLEAIEGEDAEPLGATVQVAHDDEFVYVLFQVEDDYNWNAEDAHLSGSSAVMWRIDAEAGEHMGAEEPDRETSLGMVDIWHWELECAAGEENGGAAAGPGDGEPGNDSGCNFDDEWATIPDEREDDNSASGENSLLGVWNHTNPVEDGEGTWIFEMRRPLQTGDEHDGQLEVGASAGMALAYWDPDFGPEGWEDDTHAQSANQGWIEVTLAAG
ncbi:MAG TPA: ethylbenzene dehydrogenase-related protein [Acidimicrobiia bacterium]